jgi:tetratricopeptide (TPR) repeat protein
MRQAILLMNALPRLKLAPLSDQLAAYQRVGGHPKTIELLDGWLGTGRSLHTLLDDPNLGEMLADEWEAYFLNDLLSRLSPTERDALTTLAILEEPFWWEMVRDLLAVPPRPLGEGRGEGEGWTDAQTQALLAHLLDLSLIQLSHVDKDGDVWYTLHPVVREYLLHPLTTDQRRDLHLRAAGYYGAPFVEAARQVVVQSGQTRTDEQIEQLARGRQGVVGAWVQQTQDMDHAHWAMDRALQWQHHLFQAGQVDAAGGIVTAAHAVLARWGQHDLAKALLRREIDALEDTFGRAAAQGNLASLLSHEGHLSEALAIHEELYQTFSALDAKQQMATALGQQSNILQDMGDYDRAIDKQQAALQLDRERGDDEGQAISLHQLSQIYEIKEDHDAALAHSQQAEALARKLGNDLFLAGMLHQQGLIFSDLNRPQDAFQRFNESLKIQRRIGNESGAADCLGELGKLYLGAGMMREAIVAFNEALEIEQRLGNPKMGIILEFMGVVHEMQGEYAAALEKYQQAKQIYQQAIPANLPIIEQHIARVQGKMGG